MQTKLTIPIAAANHNRAKEQIKAALAAGAEMLELRADYLKNLTPALVENLIAHAKSISGLPLIVTCRDKAEGGARDYPLQLRIDVLAAAIGAGAEFIDFEYDNFVGAGGGEKIKAALSKNPKARLLLSAHNFRTKFADIKKQYNNILSACPSAIAKLVYTANHINDCFEAFDLLHDTGGERIIFCMGDAGLISRIIAKKLGSFVTFASLDDQSATAPGQLTIEQFKKLYRYDDIKSDTGLYGIIGWPVAHSLSPALHNGCFAEAGENKLYLPLAVEGSRSEFYRFMDNVLARGWLDFAGFSVTIPHKQNALEYTKQNNGCVEPLAERIGAANTLIINESRLSAYNTDYTGALKAINSGGLTNLNNINVAVVGAGGAARAIVAGLRDAGAKVRIYNRTVERAEKLAAEFGCDFAGLDDLANLDAKLLINCTSIGMYPDTDATPLPGRYLKKDVVVFDTVYNPAETLLLKQAKAAGAKTIDGVSMFISQAAGQFKLFTGKDADTALMRKIVLDCPSRR
jgi:3-dehydroquinate dehydratase/shikimate dehydrogenase